MAQDHDNQAATDTSHSRMQYFTIESLLNSMNKSCHTEDRFITDS